MLKILIIINNNSHKSFSYLSNTTIIYSSDLISFNLEDLIINHDIIFIGGGSQRLTDINNHPPELEQIIKLIKLADQYDKLLIGICLGCQLIAYTYGLPIIKLDKHHLGFNYLDINSINYDKIDDNILKNINYNLLEKSLSFHQDGY